MWVVPPHRLKGPTIQTSRKAQLMSRRRFSDSRGGDVWICVRRSVSDSFRMYFSRKHVSLQAASAPSASPAPLKRRPASGWSASRPGQKTRNHEATSPELRSDLARPDPGQGGFFGFPLDSPFFVLHVVAQETSLTILVT